MEPALAGLVLYQPVVSTTGTWPQNIGDDPGKTPGRWTPALLLRKA